MINLNNLIDFFPYYFKENDSYKVDGKGLLERFLNICGDYFQKQPLGDLDNFLEILDVNQTNVIFVSNFWKFFGELPFAQGPVIDPEIFTKTFTGFNLDEAIEKATRSTEAYTGKSEIDYRSLIKYSVSLFKIRGTQQFFDIMFRLYGLNVNITYPGSENPFLEDHATRFDLEDTQFDKATFDNYYRCKNCSDVTFTITPPKLSNQTQVLSFANQIRAFIDRFVPFYINPIIQISGWNSLNQVKISVNPNSNLVIGLGELLQVQVTVSPVLTGNTFPSLAYQVAVTDKGVAPETKDWGQSLTDPLYSIAAGNKDYHFRPVADPTQVIKIHVTERYQNVQYMIWVDSPRDPQDLILGKILNPTTGERVESIDIVVKAVKYIFTYSDGQLTNTVSEKPVIVWDNAPEGAESTFLNGEARVSVDYYGTQSFSIRAFPTKKAHVYISVTDAYKEELDRLILLLNPKYLWIKGGSLDKGTLDANGNPSSPGVYGSDDGINWKPSEFKTTFEVLNREGIVQPLAKIEDITDNTKQYVSGDDFVPPTTGNSNYTFKATYEGKESEPVTLNIKTDAVQGKPRFLSIQVSPNPLQFEYSSGSQTKTLEGILKLTGLTKAAAQNYTPIISIKSSLNSSNPITVNGVFENYSGSIVTYTFRYSHTINGNQNHSLTFNPMDDGSLVTTVSDSVQVQVFESTTDIYMKAYDKLSQWTVNDAGASQEDKEKKWGKDLTFTAKQGEGNNIARFTFEGSYLGSIEDNQGNSYESDSDEPISIEVHGNQTLIFTAGTDTLTLNLKDFQGIVEISCSPTTAKVSNSNPEVSTTVTGSSNKSSTFRFTIDGQPAIREIPNNGAYDFKTSVPGIHTFTAVDDPSKQAFFEVTNDRPQMQVTVTELTWEPNETGAKSFELLVPGVAQVTITEED